MNNNKKWWAPVLHFVVHAIQGILILAVLLVAAIIVGELVKVLIYFNAASFVISVFEQLENVMVAVDAIMFLCYILRAAITALKE